MSSLMGIIKEHLNLINYACDTTQIIKTRLWYIQIIQLNKEYK